MKKIIKMTFVAAFAAIAGYGVYANQKTKTASDLVLANVEALADQESGGHSVSCYCKTNWFSSNVCTANGSGAYCGGDPCDSHDGNCR